jgi:hypothetical protein
MFQGEGNTKPPPKKQISPAKRWCFTLNNFLNEDLEMFSSIVPNNCSKCVIGKEIGESGTPHLQGYLEFKDKKRPKSVFNCDRIHWEKAKGSAADNLSYCSKDGEVVLTKGFPKPLKLIGDSKRPLKPYQSDIIDKITEEPDDRSILWFYGPKNIGKTQLLKLLCAKYNTYILPASKRHALSQVYKSHEETDVYAINLTADESAYQSHELFSIIEAVKDGMFSASFGTECNGMCLFNEKHILIMANKSPDWSKTEIDRKRFLIYEIDDNGNYTDKCWTPIPDLPDDY